MKAYFAYAKSIEPTLTQTSQRIIQAYFQLQRRADSRSQARTTIRLLESLIRVAQGARCAVFSRGPRLLHHALDVSSFMHLLGNLLRVLLALPN